jgi:hypothetical protein
MYENVFLLLSLFVLRETNTHRNYVQNDVVTSSVVNSKMIIVKQSIITVTMYDADNHILKLHRTLF